MRADELIERARALAPILRDRAAEAERLRRVPEQTVALLVDSGLMRAVQPRRFGGFELPYGAMLQAAVELGRACGSTAWCYAVWSSHAYMVAMFEDEAQHDYWDGSPDVLSATASNPAGARVSAAPGGYRVSGRWDFSSGCDAADWVIVGGLADDGMRHLMVPRGDFAVHDTWFVSGLRGTGSKDIVIDDVFVPAHRTVSMEHCRAGQSPGRALHACPSLRVPMFSLWPLTLAAPLVGMALGAVDELSGYTEQRVTMATLQKLSGLATVQLRIGEASARARAAHRLLLGVCDQVLERGKRDEPFSTAERVGFRLDHGIIARLCVEAVDVAFAVSGAHGLFDDSALQRFHRDIHAGAHHVGLAWDAVAREQGRVCVGLSPESPLF